MAQAMGRRFGAVAALAVAGIMGLAACQPVPPGGTDPGAPTTTSTTSTTAPTPTTTPGTKAGWTLVGGDEFNGTAVDTTKWKAYNNTYGDGNNEMACLTPGNVSEAGGTLNITSRKEQVTCPGGKVRQYTSGFLGSREAGKYYPKFARFEMRAKLPHAQGLWPAFWLRHRDGGSGQAEVDIMEEFHALRPGQTSGTLHLDTRRNLVQRSAPFEAPTANPGWHTWAVEISPGTNGGVRFVYSIDDKTYLDYTDTVHQWTNTDPAATWDIAVNQAVGGTWTGGPDDTLGYLRDLNKCSLGGTAPSGCVTTGIRRVDWTQPAAATYQVDWIRVYTH